MSCLKKVQAPVIEEDELGKAKSFRLFSIQRPHMRAFHSSWFAFFIAFAAWFGIQPLIPTIRKELGLSKKDVANTGIASIAATIVIRMVVGPLCDKFGPRRMMAVLLTVGSLPLAFAGLVKSAVGLIIIRLCIGVLGGAFIPCQFWSSAMFNVNIVGTANAFVGGWGNLGGGFTFIFIPCVFELIKMLGADEFLAWKLAVIVPVAISVSVGALIIWTTDDCPQGEWSKRMLPSADHVYTKVKTMSDMKTGSDKDKMVIVPTQLTIVDEKKVPLDSGDNGSATESQTDASEGKNQDSLCNGCNFWMALSIAVLMLQYGLCFGVELAVYTVMNLYLLYKFKVDDCMATGPMSTMENNLINGTLLNDSSISSIQAVVADPYECSVLTQNTASLIVSLFGLLNLFARAMGGVFSDVLRKYLDIPGRLLAQFICLACEGTFLIIFSLTTTIPMAITVMIAFGLFVQMAEGCTFALVPYINPRRVGFVAGFIGAGGNIGGLAWNAIWSQLVETDPTSWFWIIGVIVLSGSFLTFAIPVQNRRMWHCLRRK